MNRHVVLVTGSSGLVGSVVCRGLAEKYAFRGLDRIQPSWPDGPELGTTIVADADIDRIAHASQGCDAIVHLAGNPSVSASWPDVLESNVDLTRKVCAAAVAAGVPRVVLASSNHVTGLYEREEPIATIVAGRYDDLDPDEIERIGIGAEIRPDSPYGASKACAEVVGRTYAELHDLRVVCLRIGSVIEDDDPTNDPRHFATWCSHRDLCLLAEAALTSERQFEIIYGVSMNRWRFWELPDPGPGSFVPIDNAEDRRRG